MGAAKQAWGWYPAGNIWVPIQCDASGKLVIDSSVLAGYSKIVWKDISERALADLNRVTTLAFTDLDLTAYTSANAKIAVLKLLLILDIYTSGVVYLQLRKNGTTPSYIPTIYAAVNAASGNRADAFLMIGMDTGQVIEYTIVLTGSAQVDSYIDVLGYIE